ncbi:MAG: cysteine desulfurase [Pirellulaceae bacterium]|nr:cysteine desulfurase [Pirellulaceae bacterium]
MTDATTAFDPQRYRADFPILATQIRGDTPLVYLDNAATTQRPRQVIQSLVDVYENHYANVHRGVHWLSDQSTDLYEEAREKVRDFIHAVHSHEVIFTTGTTSAINLVARGWGDRHVAEGDQILLSVMEHHSNLVPWQQLAERRGCEIKYLGITDDGCLDLSRLNELITSKTRMVAVTAVSNVLGTVNPLETLVQAARAVGARVLVDAAQAVPHGAIDVQKWDVDFVAFSGHKMLAPTGVGILYGREEVLDDMDPFLGGGSMIRRVKLEGFESADLPAKFEAGTPPIVPAIGLGAGIDYLRQVGMSNIQRHERQLVERAHQMLADVGGIEILGPEPSMKAGIVTFKMRDIHAHDVAQLCDRQGVAIRAGHHCAMPLHRELGVNASSRASFYFYNTESEVDQLGEALLQAKRVMRVKS